MRVLGDGLLLPAVSGFDRGNMVERLFVESILPRNIQKQTLGRATAVRSVQVVAICRESRTAVVVLKSPLNSASVPNNCNLQLLLQLLLRKEGCVRKAKGKAPQSEYAPPFMSLENPKAC